MNKIISFSIFLVFFFINLIFGSDIKHSVISVGNGYTEYSIPRVGYSLEYHNVKVDMLMMYRNKYDNYDYTTGTWEYKSRKYDTFLFLGYNWNLKKTVSVVPSIGYSYAWDITQIKSNYDSNFIASETQRNKIIFNLSFLKEFNHFLVGIGVDIYTHYNWERKNTNYKGNGNYTYLDPQLVLGYTF